MVRLLKSIVRRIARGPVLARVVYDLVTASVCVGVPWALFLLFDLPAGDPLFAPIYPTVYVLANGLVGVYGRLKTASVPAKALALVFSSACAFFALVPPIGWSPIVILATFFLVVLSILPRLFFNFGGRNRQSAYLDILVHDKLPVLVVGGGGYIGSHVTAKLLKGGHRVRVFDKFLYGKEILAGLEGGDRLEIIEGDISDLYSLTLALSNVQAIVHLAGLVGDPACAVDDKLTRHINFVATRMLKESVKAFRIPRFVFASSCSVYGHSDAIVDEGSALNPLSLYAGTKIDSENEILNDHFDHFHPTILRFATVFGHSNKPRFDLVANLFAAQAWYEGTITVTGSNQWRPFIHVADVAEAVVLAVKAPREKVSRQIFNVGDDRMNVTIGDLAKLVSGIITKDMKGRDVGVVVKENVADRRNYHVAFARIRNVLGFRATVTIEEGIREIHDHFRRGTYKRAYNDPYYSNLEMAREMRKEFYSDDYQKSHFSPLKS